MSKKDDKKSLKPEEKVTKEVGSNKPTSYTAKDIYVLEGLEPVRKRPGMYIGGTGPDGLHHLIWEVADNSIDEAMAGYAKTIRVEMLPDDKIAVSDDGRGIPVETHAQTKVSALETVMTKLHAGGKFGGESYKVSGGLHGVGVSVVNALSTHLQVEVCREGSLYVQEYKRGAPQYKVKKVGKCEITGTKVIFQADPEIFQKIEYDKKRVLEHLRQQAYLTKGVKLEVVDRREAGAPAYHGFYFDGGLLSFIKFLSSAEKILQNKPFYVNKEYERVEVEVAFTYNNELETKELSFANNIYTPDGGMHLTGFRSALTRSLNDYARAGNYIKSVEDNFTGDDVREGLVVVVSVKIGEPQFEGQTKARLGSPEARTAVEAVVGEALKDFMERESADGRRIIEHCLLASKARKAAKAAKDTVLRKGVLEGLTLPGKLADCSSRNPEDSELFVVEGDSAGGCFSGDTKVALVDGRNLSFKNLIEENKKGIKNYGYTIGKNGEVEISDILHPRLTKKKAEVIKVVLDNGEEITCTPDHKFMLADGSYKKASRLTASDSLMPLYRQHSRIGKRITIEGYEMVFCPERHRWLFTHVLSDEYNIKNGIYLENSGKVHRHHKDFNKLNNNPENIIRLTPEAHLARHRECVEKTLRRPEVMEKARLARQTPEFRAKIRAINLAMKSELSQRAKAQWQNAEYKAYMGAKFLEFYNANPDYQKQNAVTLNEAQKSYWSSEDNRLAQANRVTDYFKNHPEKVEEFSRIAKAQWDNQELRMWRSDKTKEQWTDAFRVKRKKTYNETYLSKALKIMRSIYDKKGVFVVEDYEGIRKEVNDKTLLRYDTILARFFAGNNESLNEAVAHYNHKIRSMVRVEERIDVYDLEVPNTHNFALASGVFVHNSAKQGRDRRFQAILPLKGKILNVEKARVDKMLASVEVKALIIALGTAIAESFDISRLRYHKIIIMTDADVDGAHIRTLLLTLLYRHFPVIIERGHLYIAQPPLYRIQKGKTVVYAYNDAEKEKRIKELSVSAKSTTTPKASADKTPDEEREKGLNIQRYKGLGEMNPDQLWETTLNPENRVLKQVMVADAQVADKMFDVLMGEEVSLRKDFIQTHALNVKNLDI